MINRKIYTLSNFKMYALIIFLLLGAFLLIRKPPINITAGLPKIDVEGQEDNIYKIIIDKTMPMLDISMQEDSDSKLPQFIGNIFSKYISKIDVSNPKNYLKSEIPLLGLTNTKPFSASIAARSGSVINAKGDNQENKNNNEVIKNSVNFPDKPLENVKINASKPEVIIFHTHTDESFTPSAKYKFKLIGDYYSADKNYNVCRLGEEVKNYIEKYYGIAVAHDTTVNDMTNGVPNRSGSYNRARPVVESLIKKYPEAKFIIDLHRDGVTDKSVVTANIRGDQVAKTMIVLGKGNPHWQENYFTASKISQKMEQLYPGLFKRIDYANKSIYNQDISNKMILIEVGAQLNTLDEAIVSARMLARSIGEVLKAD